MNARPDPLTQIVFGTEESNMYLRTKIEPGQRLGEGLGVVTTVVKYVGGMVIEKVLNQILEKFFAEPVRGFKVTVNPSEMGLYSKISPPDRLFRPCTIDF